MLQYIFKKSQIVFRKILPFWGCTYLLSWKIRLIAVDVRVLSCRGMGTSSLTYEQQKTRGERKINASLWLALSEEF